RKLSRRKPRWTRRCKAIGRSSHLTLSTARRCHSSPSSPRLRTARSVGCTPTPDSQQALDLHYTWRPDFEVRLNLRPGRERTSDSKVWFAALALTAYSN